MMKFKKNIFLILAFLVFANVSKAQWYKPEKVNKKAIKVCNELNKVDSGKSVPLNK
jgi:hypothetical protein